jgi:GntR family transcriptional regulator, transcriptional repressor for pyruvate dehydrogenase complex
MDGDDGRRYTSPQIGPTNSTGDGPAMPASATDRATRLLESRLLDGSWPAGSRLPAERLLAASLGISRGTLREATQRLVARGLLSARPGSGVYVTDRLHGGLASPWRQLLSEHPHLGTDMLEFRRVLEGAAAELAAQRATRQDLARLRALIDQLARARRAEDEAAETALDSALHAAIADAAHNSMFGYLQSNLLLMHREHIAQNHAGLRTGERSVAQALWQQHHDLWDAIRTRAPELARERMYAHIDFVTGQLAGRAPAGVSQRAGKRVRPSP